MPSRTARLSKKGCGFATPECRAQRDLPVHAGPAAPALLPAAPHRPATTLGYMEISWVIRGREAEQQVASDSNVGHSLPFYSAPTAGIPTRPKDFKHLAQTTNLGSEIRILSGAPFFSAEARAYDAGPLRSLLLLKKSTEQA